MDWKKTPDAPVEFFERKTAPIDCERRKMFGYPCCFTGGNMFIGTFGPNIVLRLGEEDRRKALLARKGLKVFEPRPGRPMREYVVLPERVIHDDALFDKLLDASVRYARSLPAKKGN